MPLYSTVCPLPINRKIFRHISSGGAAITTSRAFDSGGGQVGDTITGPIPLEWVDGLTTVTSVIFANDNSVTSIGDYALRDTALTSITIPNSVTSIGLSAFDGCTSLATATIGTGVTSIGAGAFYGTNIASITIPSGVTSIGQSTFQDCTSLSSVTFLGSVTSIGNSAFRDCSLSSITLPNSLTSIGTEAFKGNDFTSITIPNLVTSIGDYAFSVCSSLATATIGTGVTIINSHAFSYTALTSITIPNNVLTIGGQAFKDCTSLTTAAIGTGVTSIGSYAFSGCTTLASVTCRVAQSAFTGSDAFYYTASPLTIQARITDTSWTAGTGLTFQGNTNVTVIKNL